MKSEPRATKAPDDTPIVVRVLAQCSHGSPNDIVSLSPDDASRAAADGLVDPDPAAVAYVRSLSPA